MADQREFTLSEDVAARLVRMLRWFEAKQNAGLNGGGAMSGLGNWQFVRVTGAGVVDTGGNSETYYPGQVSLRMEPDAEWSDTDGTCWVIGANLEALGDEVLYACRQTGNKTLSSSERPCFVAAFSVPSCSDCIEVVTDVDCVADELIITKKYLRLTPSGLVIFDTETECDDATGC